MGDFNKKELEVLDSIIDLINVKIFSIEQEITDKGKLDYSLCSNNYEKQKITKKKIKSFKAKIDKCPLEIAPYLLEIIKPSLDDSDFYDVIDKMSKEFVIFKYCELIVELAKEESFDFYKYTFSSVVKSRGYKYKPLKDYILSVCDVIHYIKYKDLLNINIKNEEDQIPSANQHNAVKTEIAYLNGIFLKSKDILPQSIIKAFNNIGTINSLYITEFEDKTIKNVYIDDDDPFKSIEGKVLIEYYCIESNYLNFLSKIEDSSFVFFDNLPLDLYLYEYAKAFALAYNEFEIILNQNQTLIADTQEQKALKIFSYVLNAKFKNGYFGGDYENIEVLKNKKGMYVSKDEMYEWGYKGGQYYKAWEIILNNPLIFEPLFNNYKDGFDIDKTPITNDESSNNLLKSTIEDYLEEFEVEINQNGYKILIDALFIYFSEGTFPVLTSKINFKKINKKRVGWALKELHKSEKTCNISFEYLLFAKENINLFTNETLEVNNFRKSNLYKIFTTNPAK